MPQKQTPYEAARARVAARRASRPKSWSDSAWDTAKTYGQATYEGGRDIAEGMGEMFKASRGDPMAALRVGQGGLQAVEDIKKKPSEAGLVIGEQVLGVPFRQVADEAGRGEYAKAAGHATVPLALLGLGARSAMKGRKPAGSVVDPPPPPPPQLRLPEHAGPGGKPRFYAGEAGVADATQTYRRHTGNPNPYIESGTQTLSDVGEVVTLSPELSAQGYGPSGAPEISVGKQRTRAAQAQFEAIQAEKARRPQLGQQIQGRERLNMDVEAIGGEGFPETGPSRQTPGTPSVEKITAQQPRQGYYPAEDPNVPGIGNVEAIGQQGPREVRLPAGHQSALRKMGVPEDKIRTMSMAQADAALKATGTAPAEAAIKARQPVARLKQKENSQGMKVPDPKEGNLGVATEQVKADLKSTRPYKALTDNDLMTLGTLGDAKAIKEMVGRKRGEFGREAPGAPIPGRPGDVTPFAEPRPLTLAEKLRDETGAVGDDTGKLMRERADARKAATDVPAGTVRLYRGEKTPGIGKGVPDWVREDPRYQQIQHDTAGRWFTDDPAIAKWYVDEAGEGGRVTSVDVPQDVAEASRMSNQPEAARFSRDKDREFYLPREHADRAQPGDVAPIGQKPIAKYIGEQDDFEGGSIPLYNIEGGPSHGSTVTAKTLQEMGLSIPEKSVPMAKPLTLEERQAAASTARRFVEVELQNGKSVRLRLTDEDGKFLKGVEVNSVGDEIVPRGPKAKGATERLHMIEKTAIKGQHDLKYNNTYGTLERNAPKGIVERLTDFNTKKGESGHILIGGKKPYKPIDFDKPLPASEKGNIFHRTVNKVFDTNFANWVNARNASKVEGVIKRREFADLDAAGFDGITAFQEGIVTGGRFADIKKYFDKKHEEMSNIGIKLGFRENYLPQLWENPADEVFAVSKRLALKPVFSLERVLENYQAGIAQGLKPKYKNIGELMGWYEGRANKTIADRLFFDHLRETKQILPEGKAPSEWRSINPDNFPVKRFKTARGEHVTQNYKAPPDIAKAINNYLGEGHEAFRWVGDKAGITKNIVLSSGVPGTAINAHGFNISARNVMANGVIKGGIDAAKYLINTGADNWIGRGIEKISPWDSARKFFDENLQSAADAAHHGLTVMVEDHVMGGKGSVHLLREAKTRPGKFANKGFNKFLSWQGKYFEDPLFQHVVPALKVKHWKGMAGDMMKQGVEEVAAKKAAATATNEIYGGINWESMQRSRDIQNLMRGIVLAPDWFETQYRIGKGMANTLRDPTNPRGLSYKRTAAHLVAAYVAADVINYSINKKHMWENESGHVLDIKMGSVGGKTRWVRPFGTAADFLRLPFDTIVGIAQGDLSAPGKILKNRMSTIARPAANLFMNQDAFGNPIFGPNKYGKPQTRTKQLGAAGLEVGSMVMPQYVKAPLSYATGKAGSVEEAALGTVEAPVRYSRESTKRTSRYRPTRRRPTR